MPTITLIVIFAAAVAVYVIFHWNYTFISENLPARIFIPSLSACMFFFAMRIINLYAKTPVKPFDYLRAQRVFLISCFLCDGFGGGPASDYQYAV